MMGSEPFTSFFQQGSATAGGIGDNRSNISGYGVSLTKMDSGELVAVAVMAPAAIVAVIGNLLVILSVAIEQKLRTTTNKLLVSLSITDFLVGLVSAPLMIYIYMGAFKTGSLSGRHWLQTLFWSIPNFLSVSSCLHLVAITFERFLAITRPLRHRRLRGSDYFLVVTLAPVWLVSFVWGALPVIWILRWQVDILMDPIYVIVTVGVFYTGSVLVIFSLNLFMFRSVGRMRMVERTTMAVFVTPNCEQTKRGGQTALVDHHVKMAVTILIIVVALVVAYIPNSIWWVMACFMPNDGGMTLFSLISNVLQVMNSCVNPVVYALRNKDFRLAYIRVLSCCRKGGLRNRASQSSNITSRTHTRSSGGQFSPAQSKLSETPSLSNTTLNTAVIDDESTHL